jgi:hypothetical protein
MWGAFTAESFRLYVAKDRAGLESLRKVLVELVGIVDDLLKEVVQ